MPTGAWVAAHFCISITSCLAAGATRNYRQMKKNLFYTVMMMAVMAVVTISFTACGGGDDDPLTDKGKESAKTYMEPCLDWGCDVSHIKTYMGNSMNLVNEQINEQVSVLAYSTSDSKYVITYGLMPKLFQVSVYHYDKSHDYFQKLMSQYETRYQAKFEKSNKEEIDEYGANCTINGKYCGIIMQYEPKTSSIFVLFGLAD